MKKYFILASIFLIEACASNDPQTMKSTPSVLCMNEAIQAINNAVDTHAKVFSHSSREQVCAARVATDKYFQKRNDEGQNVVNIGGNVLMIRNEINFNNKTSTQMINECLSSPNVKAVEAPLMFQQLSRVVFAIENHELNQCPAPFQAAYAAHLSARIDGLLVARKFSHLTSSDWTNIAFDVEFINYQTPTQSVYGQEVRTLKVPGNANEKLLIDVEKNITKTYFPMFHILAKETGRCFNENTKRFYSC
jgi:hypothetical protein